MYVLDALRSRAGAPQSEFRLLCSGALYNGNYAMTDWTKSDAARLLLSSPVVLLVVSQPPQAYPQELLLQVPIARVLETRPATTELPGFTKSFVPHVK
jgi:hypothetical protein